MEKKICSKCGYEKPLTDFPRNGTYYYSLCKNCKNEYKRKYNIENRDKRLEYKKSNKHVGLWRSVLKMSIWRMNGKKEGYTIDLLGYSALEFKEHIETLFTDGMSWDNHGEWHVDHIKNVIEFSEDTPPNIVNALSNLRPMWSTTREINGVVYEGNLNRNKLRRKKL